MFTLSVGSLFLLALCVHRASSRALSILAVLVAAVSALLAALGYAAGAGASFNMRSLTLNVLPVLMLATICFHAIRLDVSNQGWLVAGVVFSLLGIGYATSWAPWKNFRSSVVTTLEANAGYVALEDTVLAGSSQRWDWTMLLLSVLWSGGCARTIVLNQQSLSWEPFDPRQSLPLQTYVAYGLPFAEASPSSRSCR